MRTKYTDGQIEHGGQLWRKKLLASKIEEDLDNLIYGLTMVEQHEEAERLVKLALATLVAAQRDRSWFRVSSSIKMFTALANLLHYGNVEGEHIQDK
jgi:hypothetical protein